jgi:hypothetical protein
MIAIAAGIAITTYKDRFACRFLTVDADIEHDQGLLKFYTKNGFVSNTEMNTKKSKTINMRRELFTRLQPKNISLTLQVSEVFLKPYSVNHP